MQREADVREPVGNAGRVLAALREFGRPISAYDVLDRLRPNGVRTPTTVYRALKALIEMRLVHRLEALNAYVACAHPRHADDVCFAICEACRRVDEIHDQRLRQFVGDWCESESFLLSRTAVELIGTCILCRGGVARDRGARCEAGRAWTLLAGGNPVSWPASPLRLGLATRLVCAGATATILWLAVLWAIS